MWHHRRQIVNAPAAARSAAFLGDWAAYAAAMVERPQRCALVLAGIWTLAVIAALVSTLVSLDQDSFDGLNNFWQLPLALPWALIPVGLATDSHVIDAWLLAAMGLVNAVLIYHRFARRRPALTG